MEFLNSFDFVSQFEVLRDFIFLSFALLLVALEDFKLAFASVHFGSEIHKFSRTKCDSVGCMLNGKMEIVQVNGKSRKAWQVNYGPEKIEINHVGRKLPNSVVQQSLDQSHR